MTMIVHMIDKEILIPNAQFPFNVNYRFFFSTRDEVRNRLEIGSGARFSR